MLVLALISAGARLRDTRSSDTRSSDTRTVVARLRTHLRLIKRRDVHQTLGDKSQCRHINRERAAGRLRSR
jgi:hypothetical protein